MPTSNIHISNHTTVNVNAIFFKIFRAIEQLGGLETESEYPYDAKKSKCRFDPSLVRVKVSGAVDLPKNETAMALYLVKNGPLSIGMFYVLVFVIQVIVTRT